MNKKAFQEEEENVKKKKKDWKHEHLSIAFTKILCF